MKTVFKVLLGILVLLFLAFYYTFFYAPKVHFTDGDLTWFYIYDVGDTLIFQNVETKVLDTSIITKREIYNHKYDWLRHDGYRPISAKLWYKNKALIYGTDYQDQIFGREKRKPNDSVSIGVSYLYSNFYLDSSFIKFDNVTLNTIPKTFNHVYIFKNEIHPRHTQRDDFKPQTLCWDEQYGIIKYETYSGEVWELINW